MGIYRCHYGGIWSKTTRPQQIKAEIETAVGIYCIEQSPQAAKLVKNRIQTYGYLGISFLRPNYKVYLKSICILFKEFGVISTIKLIIRSLNCFSALFHF